MFQIELTSSGSDILNVVLSAAKLGSGEIFNFTLYMSQSSVLGALLR